MKRKTSVIAVPLLVSGAVLAMVATSGSASGSAPREDRSAQGRSKAEDYRQLLAALTDGESVAVTLNHRECTNEAGEKGRDSTDGLHIDSFHGSQEKISFSDVHNTLDQQNHKVTEYIRYRVTPDGKVSLETTTTDADNKVIREGELQCSLGKGAVFSWSTDSHP